MSATPGLVPAGCDKPSAEPLLHIDKARRLILGALSVPPAVQSRSLHDALGCVLAEDVIATIDVPLHTNAAVDGYALHGDDLDTNGAARLSVTGKALAGTPFAGTAGRGECVQVMTGAVMPVGTDTVVMQEDCVSEGKSIRVAAGQQHGQNVRRAGEDLARGSAVLTTGMRLLSAHIGVLASLGLSEVRVHRPLRAAIVATGDELRSVGQSLAEGQIYDSNRYTLNAMLRRLGISLIDMGIVEDHPDALQAAFTSAAREADVVITTGGVSVGDADYVRLVLEKLGRVQFWKIAMKPGRPFAFGQLGNALFFGLPGNPVAAMVTFYQLVQPALLRLGGESCPPPPIGFRVPCRTRLRKQPGRTEYIRAVLETDEHGQTAVRSLHRQGSGILTSMALANCFIVLPHEGGPVEAGDLVTVQPFSGLV